MAVSENPAAFINPALLGKPSGPAIIASPADLNFNMAILRGGVPGINDIGETFGKNRDWNASYQHPTAGFAGVRWCPSWVRADRFFGDWEPAGADIYRIQRKGNSGVDAQTLVFTCSPNTAEIPVGESVVVWDSSGENVVVANTSHNLSGYALPTRSKLPVSRCVPSSPFSAVGRRIIEVNAGAALPAIDFTPPWYQGEFAQKSTMQLRHWAFYKNTATRALRNPIKRYAANTRKALAGNGYVMLGGGGFATSAWDWSKEYLAFGATLASELFRLECEGLARLFGDTDPRKLAVELEAATVHQWNNTDTVPGYRLLLSEVFYPIARLAWGQERTLVVKPGGGILKLLSDFDWRAPKGHNIHLATHVLDDVALGDDGSLSLATIQGADWMAQRLDAKVDGLGYRGGGITLLGVVPPRNTVEKAKRLGRVLTSIRSRQLYAFYYANAGTDPATTFDCADIYVIGGNRIEALHPEMRQYASRAGQTLD